MPTDEDLAIMEEMEEALGDSSRQRDDRSAEDPKGMRLSQKSNITMAGEPVAARTQAWRTDDGREIWLPSAMLPQMLAKRLNGQRIFTLRKPAIAEREPLDLKCVICSRAGTQMSRKFYERSQYFDHMEILHPREWARMQREDDLTRRDTELADRREELAIMRTMAERGAPNGNESPTAAAPDSGTVEASGASEETWLCPACLQSCKSKAGLAAHQRSHA